MSTRVLLIDDAPDFLNLLERTVVKGVPDASVTRIDPNTVGLSDTGFGLEDYDVVLLDYDLGPAGDGIEWLKRVKESGTFPPTVVVTSSEDPYVAARAIKAGACDYLRKRDLESGSLATLIREAMQTRNGHHGTHDRGGDTGTSTGTSTGTGTGTSSSTTGNTFRSLINATERTIALPQGVSAEPSQAGNTFVRGYTMEYKLGEGATAEVYLARHDKSGRVVVLKIVTPELLQDNEFLERFLQEADLVIDIDSPHVVKIYEQAFTDDGGFIAMEHLPGGDLRAAIKQGVDTGRAVEYFRQVTQGLSSIHAVGIVHRDLKPANVMLREDGSLALVDFGISKRSGNEELTQLGAILGTPHYMSPEQARGRPIDERSDLYASGIILYEMLTGKRPFDGTGAAELLYQHAFGDRPVLPEAFARYQPFLERVLAIEPDERPSSAAQMLAEFDAIPH